MSNYTKTTDFEAKDSLPSGDSGKIIRGSEFETEFDNIATAIATKADAANPTFTGTVTIDGLTVNGNTTLGNAATDTVTVTADIASNLIPSADDTYNLGASGAEWNDLYVDGTAYVDAINFNGTAITATAAELNIMDGVTATTAELNYVDGVTSAIQTQLDSKANLSGANFTGNIDVTGTVTADGLTVDGNVGIGTSSPSTNLEISDASAAVLRLTDSGLSAYSQVRADAGTLQLDANAGNAAVTEYISMRIAGSESMRIDSTGNVGIGTSSPATALHVLNTSDAQIRLSKSGVGSYDLGVIDGDKFAINRDGLTNEFVMSSGNVGIGTVSPSGLLHISAGASGATPNTNANDLIIESGTNAGISILGDGNEVHYLMFGDAANSTVGRVLYDHNSDHLALWTNGSEAMRVDSNGNVGIGTTSPGSYQGSFNDLVVAGSANSGITIASGTTSEGTLAFADGLSGAGTDAYRGYVQYEHDGDQLRFGVAGSEAMRIDSSGRVGIGTTSPATTLTVEGSSANGIELNRNGADAASSARLFFDSSTNCSAIFNTGGNLVFATGATPGSSSGTERMRLDSSGNLLVAKTAASTTNTVGHELDNDGHAEHIIDGTTTAHALMLNRKSTDGTLIDFRKDNATVGSIGVDNSDNLYITGNSSHAGLMCGSTEILPYKGTTLNDGANDLGASSFRWKDLYLSGGAYLGGTGAANKLDDYEEGTFTPALTFGGADTGNVYGSQTGRYTKIGNVVHVDVYVRLTTLGSATGNAEISGLPFTVNSGNESGGSVGYFINLTGLTSTPIVRPAPSGTTLELRDTTASDAVRITHGNFTATSDIRLSATYKV